MLPDWDKEQGWRWNKVFSLGIAWDRNVGNESIGTLELKIIGTCYGPGIGSIQQEFLRSPYIYDNLL